MKHLTSIILLLLACVAGVRANDGVYFTSGNFLVPTKETDISVAKEILTITIGRDSLAKVDVYYELMNNGDPKTVTMAFEANAPYNACAPLNRNGVHPFIKNFSVVMNDQTLTCDNRVIVNSFEKKMPDYTPLDLKKWKGYGEVPDSLGAGAMDDALYNAELDSVVGFSYGYFFQAPFKHGMNKVHHTYSYLMNYNVMERFCINYCLTPATRWANHQIDDFTLRIKGEIGFEDFCMVDTLFDGAPFKIVGGLGDIHQVKMVNGEHKLFVELHGGYLEWHKENFCPTDNMEISDSEPYWKTQYNEAQVVIDKNGDVYRLIGDCGNTYYVSAQDVGEISKEGCRVETYSVDNGHGWVYPNDYGTYNIRKSPTTKSPIVGKMTCSGGELPDTLPCLGQVQQEQNGDWHWWYKVRLDNGKIGYVRGDFMEWDCINVF